MDMDNAGPIDFRALDDLHARLQLEARETRGTGDMGEEEGESVLLDYNVSEIIHLTLLSRVVECLRFSLRAEILDVEVTLEKLISEFHLFENSLGSKPQSGLNNGSFENISMSFAVEAEETGMPQDVGEEERQDRLKKIEEGLTKIWRSWEMSQIRRAKIIKEHDEKNGGRPTRRKTSLKKEKNEDEESEKKQEAFAPSVDTEAASSPLLKAVTFGDLLDYQFPSFPETTEEDRKKLKVLGRERPVIGRLDVCRKLGVGLDSQLVDYIFASGASVLSAEVFKEITASLDLTPRSVSFAPAHAERLVNVGRRGAPLVPNLIIFVMILVFIPATANINSFMGYTGLSDFIGNDWATGCFYQTTVGAKEKGAHSGPSAEIGCEFVRRTYDGMQSATFDLMRFSKEEFFMRLWPNAGGSADAQEFGSTWLLGSLLIRHVPVRGVISDSVRSAQCSANRISTTLFHLQSTAYFDCDNYWSVIIPFNTTREEALDIANKTIQILDSVQTDSALIFEFSSYSRSHGLFYHMRTTVALPKGGTAMPYNEISPIDPKTSGHVLPLLVVQFISFIVVLANAIFLQVHGVFSFGFDFWVSFLNTTFLVVSYALLIQVTPMLEINNLNRIGGSFYQTEYQLQDMDKLATYYNDGMNGLGFYVLFFIMMLGRFFRDIAGLELVVSVLRRSWVELLSLALIFVVWTLGFTMVAMTIFGPTVDDFATFFNASLTLLDYFQDVNNYDNLVAYHKIAGPAFFFVYQLFVILFALNLLVAVLTAPLVDVQKETKIDNMQLDIIQSEVVAKREGSTQWDQMKWWMYSHIWLPFVTMCWDARPGFRSYWLPRHMALATLYPQSGYSEPVTSIEAAVEIAKSIDHVDQKLLEWNSELLRFVISRNAIRGKVSLALMVGMIATESTSGSLRDSRLLNATTQFSRFIELIQSIQDTQEALKPISFEQTRALEEKLELALKCAEESLEAMPYEAVKELALSGYQDFTPKEKKKVEEETKEAEPETAGGGSGDDGLADEDDVDHDTRRAGSRYYFGERINDLMTKSPLVIFFAVIILIFAIQFITPFLNVRLETAHLSDALDAGLRDMHQTTRCVDAKCTSGQTWGKVIDDNIMLQDWVDWMNNVIEPQVFRRARMKLQDPSNDLDPTWSNPDALAFDLRINRITPLYLRQLRAKPKVCIELPKTARDTLSYGEHVTLIESEECFEGVDLEFATEPIPPPASGYHPDIGGRAAYTHSPASDKCRFHPEPDYMGFFATYPCGGYVATLNTSASLWAAIDYKNGWINSETRLLALTAHYQFGPPELNGATVEYTIFQEIGNSGQIARAAAQSHPIGEIRVLEDTYPYRIGFQVVLCIVILIFLGFSARFFVYSRDKTKTSEEVSSVRPSVPTLELVAFAVIYLFCYPLWWEQEARLDTGINVVAIIYIQIVLSSKVVFPAASLLSKNVKVLIDTLSLAALHCLYVFPFLAIFYLSFSYSGIVFFGRAVESFALLRSAVATVFLSTFGVSDDIFNDELLESFRPQVAQIYTLLFFCGVLIVLANMFLAMVTSASADAQQTPPTIMVAENVQYFYHRVPMYGEWVNAFLACNVAWIEFKKKNARFTRKYLPKFVRTKRPKDPVILTPWGRLWFPCECLVPRIRPMRITYLLQAFHYDRLTAYAYGALIPFILANFLEFCVDDEKKHLEDEADNNEFVTSFVKGVAKSVMLARAKEMYIAKETADQDDEDRYAPLGGFGAGGSSDASGGGALEVPSEGGFMAMNPDGTKVQEEEAPQVEDEDPNNVSEIHHEVSSAVVSPAASFKEEEEKNIGSDPEQDFCRTQEGAPEGDAVNPFVPSKQEEEHETD